jgi:hypothetical protein
MVHSYRWLEAVSSIADSFSPTLLTKNMARKNAGVKVKDEEGASR